MPIRWRKFVPSLTTQPFPNCLIFTKMRWWQWRTNVFTDMGESISSLREGRLSRISGKKKLAEGGSSITQQLAKNLYFSQEKKFLRKVAELFVAFDLEKNYSKDEILELYLNTIYFGSGYYCVYDAAEGYFGKEPGQMNDFESTLLAGIPNAPSVYALTNKPELAAQRQRTVLECMVDQKYLTSDDAKEILKWGEQAKQAMAGETESQ